MTDTYKLRGGRPTIAKAPKARKIYGLDLVKELEGGTATDVTAIARGVVVDGAIINEGTRIGVPLKGLDEREGAVNCCTFTWTGPNGTDSRTIWFTRR